MEEKLEYGECYICLEDTPLLSQCFCVKRYLCENCLEKLRIYNYKQCTVCHAYYPKMLLDQIQIRFSFEDQPSENYELTETYGCTPCCLRPRAERHNPKYCLLDFLVHIFCIYVFMLIASCGSNPHATCYGWNIINFFFPAVVVYLLACALLSVVRR